ESTPPETATRISSPGERSPVRRRWADSRRARGRARRPAAPADGGTAPSAPGNDAGTPPAPLSCAPSRPIVPCPVYRPGALPPAASPPTAPEFAPAPADLTAQLRERRRVRAARRLAPAAFGISGAAAVLRRARKVAVFQVVGMVPSHREPARGLAREPARAPLAAPASTCTAVLGPVALDAVPMTPVGVPEVLGPVAVSFATVAVIFTVNAVAVLASAVPGGCATV